MGNFLACGQPPSALCMTCTCNADPSPAYTVLEKKQYNGKCYTMYATNFTSYSTDQNYCVQQAIPPNYGQLVTFASWTEFTVISTLFVNQPNSAHYMYIGLKSGSPPIWDDPHGVCGNQTLSGVINGPKPSACSSSWYQTITTAGSYVFMYNWCDWEADTATHKGFFCEYGMLYLSSFLTIYCALKFN